MSVVQITPALTVGNGNRLLVMAGPCLVEDDECTLRIAKAVKSACDAHDVDLVFKASFDKANRSSALSERGPGLDRGLAILARIKRELAVPLVTDIHESWQAAPAAEVVDVLQIPAFLSRQTDLLAAAAATGRVVNVKKGQFLAPSAMVNVVDKLVRAGASGILLTERGSSFGYGNLVVDFRALPQLRALGWPVIFDATHSVQLPGGLGTSSGGEREHVAPLARAAAAVGVDGLFVEVHEDPDHAPSDGPNMLTPAQLDGVLRQVVAIRATLLATIVPPDA